MTDSERYKKYVKEHCKTCANKDTNLCEIRVMTTVDKKVIIKCEYYKNENPKTWKKTPISWQNW